MMQLNDNSTGNYILLLKTDAIKPTKSNLACSGLLDCEEEQ
ncbi:MAG TPA: hypothetical protein VE244_09665 [Nitrososphaeraceae archaeon]|nr:hypothetical protein [Nitrososphaeraceae archaeon]